MPHYQLELLFPNKGSHAEFHAQPPLPEQFARWSDDSFCTPRTAWPRSSTDKTTHCHRPLSHGINRPSGPSKRSLLASTAPCSGTGVAHRTDRIRTSSLIRSGQKAECLPSTQRLQTFFEVNAEGGSVNPKRSSMFATACSGKFRILVTVSRQARDNPVANQLVIPRARTETQVPELRTPGLEPSAGGVTCAALACAAVAAGPPAGCAWRLYHCRRNQAPITRCTALAHHRSTIHKRQRIDESKAPRA